MTPAEFIARWKNNPLSERAGAQTHFNDLCDLLGVDKPVDPANYCFERGAKKASGGEGWADVWKRGHFAWENKKPGRDLKAALKQLTDYALNLDNPPLLVVCDREIIEIHTAFTGYPDEVRTILIEELADPAAQEVLRWVFVSPEKLRPQKSNAAITEEMAGQFAELSAAMRGRGLEGQQVAHFLVQCLFAMFAEDEGLLPKDIFSHLLDQTAPNPKKSADRLQKLFLAMQEKSGTYGNDDIEWFNGGLFQKIDIPPLSIADLESLQDAAGKDWRAINASIFGTLFERGLDPGKRAQLGAHYTDPQTIEKLIRPLISEPLLCEWADIRARMEAALATQGTAKTVKKYAQQARAAYQGFLLRLENFRVLDPACGSGNFLYLALKALRDVEKRANVDAQEMGFEADLSLHTGPHNILGLEINEFAAELARVTVWIGDIQWSHQNYYPHAKNPILRSLSGIRHQDALLNADGSEAAWPEADVIVGNPPLLGGSKKRRELGDDYFAALNKVYAAHVPGGADLVCYWFHKARAQMLAGKLQAAGLVATQAIRNGSNRKVLDAIVADARIFEAWSDEAWVNEGAAVRVSLVGFAHAPSPDKGRAGEGFAAVEQETTVVASGTLPNPPQSPLVRGEAKTALVLPSVCFLNGQEVAAIHADLTAGGGVNLTEARVLAENAGCSFEGTKKYGKFDISGELARRWLTQPNPNGQPNSMVVKPWANGLDITKRPSDKWIIDFGVMPENTASLFELPYEFVLEHVKPARQTASDEKTQRNWWLHERNRVELRKAVKGLPRFIVTPRVAKHRFFVWRSNAVLPDTRLCVIARADDVNMGILSSHIHEVWALANASMHGVGNYPTYVIATCFETFPFPEGMTPRDSATPSPDKGRAGEGFAAVEQETTVEASGTSPNPPQFPLVRGEANPHAERIAAAARRLNELRENWLNPPEWVDWVITPAEEAAGFPKRPIAKPGFEAELKKRTLTNLYNQRPAWLDNAHKALDAAVAAAYGWQDYTPETSDAEILKRLLKLNQARS
ncbi:MAG: N-6 DNA methylase [Zoogloeaceae bacterium]|jgi:hypothetical protein|nr:N-6 DNA methylase [Zoogloeaceae bacterium]